MNVTILILIDGFLQYEDYYCPIDIDSCHNPYFNRWFSAIQKPILNGIMQKVTILILIDGFLQCKYEYRIINKSRSHNPYFNRWFSAI